MQEKFDIKKRQQEAHKAAVKNSESANKFILSSQNWLLLLALAELSFLGSLLFVPSDNINTCFVKLSIIALLISFISFILGSVLQYKNALRKARKYENISQKAVIKYLNKNKRVVNKIPDELKLPEQQIATDKKADLFISTSYFLVVLSTLGIVLIILVI